MLNDICLIFKPFFFPRLCRGVALVFSELFLLDGYETDNIAAPLAMDEVMDEVVAPAADILVGVGVLEVVRTQRQP